VVVGQEDHVDARQFFEVDCGIGAAGAGDSWSEMHVVAGVEEVGICEDA
jgi:hypothetical protein